MTAEAEKINAARNDAIADIRSAAAELVQITVLKLSGSEVSKEEALSTVEKVNRDCTMNTPEFWVAVRFSFYWQFYLSPQKK